MKMITKAAMAAAAFTLAPIVAPSIATAQSVAYSDYDMMIAGTNAYKAADAQIRTSFKAQLDAIDSRSRVLDAELNAMKVRFEADYKANPKNPALPQQLQAIREKEAAAKDEIQRMSVPVLRAYAFVEEQIAAKLPTAVTQAMGKKRVSLLVRREAILQNTPGTDLTPDIIAEVNVLVPSVSITPPANWQPGQTQAQGARPAVTPAPGVAPAPAPAPAVKPKGR